MEPTQWLDRAGRHRAPATTSSFHRGVPPRNKGLRYPPDGPTVPSPARTTGMRIPVTAAGPPCDPRLLRGGRSSS
jgi:hypothetical protein